MDKFSIDLTLYQRITSDGIQAIIQPYGNNQTLQTYINFAKETSQGIEAQMEYRMNKVFKTTASFVWGQMKFENPETQKMKFENPETQITFNNAKSWSARLQQQFKLSNDWKIEFTENYRAPRFSAQRKMQEWFYINFALNKKINKKRGSISLRVSDIFNTKQWGYSLVTDEFEVERIEKWQTRNITLGLRKKNAKKIFFKEDLTFCFSDFSFWIYKSECKRTTYRWVSNYIRCFRALF